MKKIVYTKTCSVLLLLFILSSLIIFLKIIYFKNKEEKLTENIKNTLEDIENEGNKNETVFEDGSVGLIVIPSLGIEAPIFEGTDKEILKYCVGHFENTSLWNGNVALASHNEGSYAHYFEEINKLKNGEEIIYITNMGERRYKVFDNKEIKETDVKVLQNTKENIITLITCITGKREYRRCVIAIEKI